jgi:deazaflavin-dependent oxidoreductase (nitroreductase family)
VPLEGQYIPSPQNYVAEHVRRYEEAGADVGGPFENQPCVILTTRGRRTGLLRKVALVRVEHSGRYALIASKRGAASHPEWYLNLIADPEVTLQDADRVMDLHARTASTRERAFWWPQATVVWPQYDEYQAATERKIPVVLLEPR